MNVQSNVLRDWFSSTAGPIQLALLITGITIVGAATAQNKDKDQTELGRETAPKAAELVVLGATIVTASAAAPEATALAIRDGRFLAVGSAEDVAPLIGPETRRIDAKGRTLLPGFVDSHSHLLSGAGLATGVDLTEIEDQHAWLRIIAARAASLPEGTWILGGAWDHNLSGGAFPTREMLDAVTPRHPVLLRDIDGHSAWANSKAIELAGVTANAPVPPGGKILLDDDGEPNGIFLEGAMGLFARAPGMREATDPVAGLRAAIQLANRFGITTLHDMSGDLDAFLTLVRRGELSTRIWLGAFVTPRVDLSAAEQIAAAAAERTRIDEALSAIDVPAFPGPMLTLGFTKFVVDGVLSSYTALLASPYSDDPTADPEAFLSRERLEAQVAAAVAARFAIATHAIGDRAVTMALDAYAGHPPEPGIPGHRIEHIEVIEPGTVARFKALGVAASMQPHHATCCVGSYVIDRIGKARIPYAYAWRSFQDAGVPLLFSADWPTSPLSPLVQIADAMERRTMRAGKEQPWDTGQQMTFEEALIAYTRRGAEYTSWQASIGEIAPGRLADFLLLDRKLDTSDARDVRGAAVVETYLGGKRVFPVTAPESS